MTQPVPVTVQDGQIESIARKIKLAADIRIRALIGVSVLALTATTLSMSAAYAQEASTSAEGSIEQVVVTGTRIVRSDYDTPTPVTVVSSADLQAAAPQNLTDFVNELPELSGSTTPQTSYKSISAGGSGLSLLNLRNLGTTRTLVLVDGQRSVTSDITGETDINDIPQDLVSRVDVVTGGASATYGSDAIAGVVNFVLDKTYTGIKGNFSRGQTTYGDDGNWNASLTAGTGFAGDRGHLLLDGEISNNDGIISNPNARPWMTTGWKTINNPTYTATNGQPQELVLNDVGLSNATPGGIITSGALKGIYFGPGGTPSQLNYGSIVSAPYMQGGDWQYTDDEGYGSLDPEVRRQGLFGRVSYDIMADTNVYVQTSYNYTQSASADAREYYLGNLNVNSNNPFLPAAVAAEAQALGPTLQIGTTLADLPAYDSFGSYDTRSVSRYVLGGSGKFDLLGAWDWNGYYQKGISNVNQNVNVALKSRFANAIDAVRAPNGAIVCASSLTAPGNGCVPFDPFGTGVNSQAAIDYVLGDGVPHGHIDQTFTQDVAELNAQGEPFSLWAGPVSVAFGVTHRREAVTGKSTAEDMAEDEYAGNFLPVIGHYDVNEGYLETVVPLVKNQPLIQELSVDAAVRAIDYSISGYVTTWKASGSYSPIDDVRFRFTQSHDIRAPNLSDLFVQGATAVFTVIDPLLNNAQYNVYDATSGNIKLKPEVANSTDLGAVFQPSFLSGLNLSVDYYRIAISNAIGSTASQTEVNLCYQGAPQYCSAIVRGGPVVNGVSEITLVNQTEFNQASQIESGMDISASYATPVDAILPNVGGNLALRMLATNVYEDTLTTGIPGQIPNDSAGTNGGSGPPHWRYLANITYGYDPISLTLTGRGLSAGKYNNNFIQCTAGCPTSTANNFTINDNQIDGAFYFDANIEYNFQVEGSTDQLYFHVQNVLNTDPAVVAPAVGGTNFNAVPANNTLYDTLGRTFRAGIRFNL